MVLQMPATTTPSRLTSKYLEAITHLVRIAEADRAELERIRDMTGVVIHTDPAECVGCGCMSLTAGEAVACLVMEVARLRAKVGSDDAR